MTKRKLASIRRIVKITPIEGADFIETAQVDGWQCIVKKGTFKKGDMCVFFEIDSVLPIDERYEFLRKTAYKKYEDGTEGFRIKTKKMLKHLSQGLALPLSDFPELSKAKIKYRMDLTDLLRVKKVDNLKVVMTGEAKGTFPSFIQKTDEERIQNLLGLFKSHKKVPFEVTEKLDGSSMTVYNFNKEFGVCSRNIDLKIDDANSFVKKALELQLNKHLPAFGNIALQGELIGTKIQKNPYKINGHEYHIFNIWSIDKFQYLTIKERAKVFLKLQKKIPELKHVPYQEKYEKIFSKCPSLDEILKYSEGHSIINENVQREGLVFKDLTSQLSFKTINNKYLLGEK
jgi:RNA ligase (TIGR02306 family)